MSENMFERASTAMQMDEAKDQSGVLLAMMCCMLILNVWIPCVFLTAAGNVNEGTCEADMAGWFRINTVVTYAAPPFITLVQLCGACAGMKCIFKCGHSVQMISALLSLVMIIWGWTIFFNTSSETCKADPGGWDPHLVLKIILFLQLGIVCLVCCCGCCLGTALAGMVGAVSMADEEEKKDVESSGDDESESE